MIDTDVVEFDARSDLTVEGPLDGVDRLYLVEEAKHGHPLRVRESRRQVGVMVLHVNNVQLQIRVFRSQGGLRVVITLPAPAEEREAGYLHGVLLPVDGVLRARTSVVAPVQVKLHGLVTVGQASA